MVVSVWWGSGGHNEGLTLSSMITGFLAKWVLGPAQSTETDLYGLPQPPSCRPKSWWYRSIHEMEPLVIRDTDGGCGHRMCLFFLPLPLLPLPPQEARQLKSFQGWLFSICPWSRAWRVWRQHNWPWAPPPKSSAVGTCPQPLPATIHSSLEWVPLSPWAGLSFPPFRTRARARRKRGSGRLALAPAGSRFELATDEVTIMRTQGLKAESRQEELGLTVVILWKRSVWKLSLWLLSALLGVKLSPPPRHRTLS